MRNDLKSVYLKYEVSVRLYNAFGSNGINTLEDLIIYIKDKGIKNLLKLNRVGIKSINEIDELFNRFNISEEDIYSYNPEIGLTEKYEIPQTLNISKGELIEQDANPNDNRIPNLLIDNIKISSGIRKRLNAKGIHSTAELISYCRSCGLANLCEIGKYDSLFIRELSYLLNILQDKSRWNELSRFMKSGNRNQLPLCEVTTSSIGIFPNISEDEQRYAYQTIQNYYISNLTSLSTGARQIIKGQIPTFVELLFYVYLLCDKPYGLLKNCGKTKWVEIRSYSGRILNEINRINTHTPQNLAIAVLMGDISYQCYDEDEEGFIKEHYSTFGHLPMFYILSYYFLRSEKRFEIIYRNAYGILCEQIDLRNIAKTLGVTFERVRQIVSGNKINNQNIVKLSNWKNYQIGDILYLSKRSGIYKEVRINENLDALSFVGFGYLCKLLVPLTHISINDNHYFFALKLQVHFDINGAIEDIKNTLSKKVARDVILPISIFMDGYWKGDPDFEPDEIIKILREIIIDNFDVDIDDNHRITIHQNSIDIFSELYQIIKENGKPISINDIFIEFKKKYPNHKYYSASQLRPYLLKDERICPKGKTSCYALTEWNIYTGTIKDLIYETLFKSDLPLTAEELCVLIHDIYETSPKSVRSTVVADKGGKFIFFKNGYIGLKSKSYPDEYNDVTLSRKPRQSFQDSLAEYERYLATHHHMPFSTGTEVEQFLYKWYGNVIGKRISLNVKQEADFNAMIERNKEYMVNGIEYAFFRRCDDYKVFLEENMELPTLETDAALYNWFQTQIKKYTEFEDRRYGYFEDLLKDIESYGFIVNINKDKGLF